MVIFLAQTTLINASTDDDKRMELEKRIELLENEVEEIRRTINIPNDDNASEYVSAVLVLIKENWFYPDDLDVRPDDFLRVSLTINRDGVISNQKILDSSGNEPFNGFALECISKTSPLPPLPDEINKETKELELRFRPHQT